MDLSDEQLLRYSRQIMLPEVDIAGLAERWASLELVGPVLGFLTPTLGGVVVGIAAGGVLVLLATLWQRLRGALG